MDSSWLSVAPAVSIALCLLVLPGFLVVLAAGVPFRTAVGLSGVVSASVLAVSALVAPYLGMSWNTLTVFIGTLIAAALTFLVRLLLNRLQLLRLASDEEVSGDNDVSEPHRYGFWRSAPGREAAALGAVGLAACLIGYRFLQIFQQPQYISQTADNVFHLNVVRYIQDTDSGSALTAGGVAGNGPEFYPAVWHSAVALVADMAHVSIPAATNSVNIVIGTVLWPLGAVFVSRVLFGSRTIALFAAAVVASAFSAYPYLLVDWGVLYPNFYAMALVLPALALTALLLRRTADQAPRTISLIHLWLLFLVIPGLALTHPNALLVFIVAILPLLLVAYATWGRRILRGPRTGSRTGQIVWLAVAGLAGGSALSVSWAALRPLPVYDFSYTWQPYQTTAQAIGEVLLTTHAGRGAAYATAILVVVGGAAMLRAKYARWYVASYLFTGLLFVFASGVQNSPLRTFLTGGWYDDQNRLAAAVAILAVPLAVKGVLVAACLLGSGLQRLRIPAAPASTVAGTMILMVLFVASQDSTVRPATQIAMRAYSLGPNSDIMSTDELALYEQIDDIVPEEAAVAGNPWEGSAWVYMVSGRTAVFPHVQTLMTPERTLVAESLNQAATRPDVCEALHELHIKYAVTSSELIYLPGNPANERYPGISNLEEAPGFEKVAEVGAAELFRITACD